jgi:hypothetical protein
VSGGTGVAGDNLANYTVFDANSVDFGSTPPQTIADVVTEQPAGSTFNVTPSIAGNTVTLSISPSSGKREFRPGDWVNIVVSNVQGTGGSVFETGFATIVAQVPGGPVRQLTRDVEDAISYPVLTEEVAYRPSPVGIQTSGAGGIAGPGASNLGQRALQAVTDVLGWKANPADPKGFIGALTQSFTLKDVEGHVEATWTPRSYAVQTDLGGGITGAQASLYSRAKDALDQALTLLDGLYPLDPEADPEYVKALREMARSQMTEIVKELGIVGLPSILRIDTYFDILLGQNPGELSTTGAPVEFNPDHIEGTLGKIRDTYGIEFVGNKFNNSVEDEQDITNFRVISDYMTSLMQSWIANREFFEIKTTIPAFFGTQLVLISRQFNVIAETANEARFALDSVFIGPNERQTLLLEFHDPSLPAMFLEDVLDEIDKFVGDEGPRLLRDGGKISVKNNILPVVRSLKHMIDEAHHPKNASKLPDGFRTARVQHSLDDLRDQLRALIELTEQVEQDVPQPEDRLIINNVTKPFGHSAGPYKFSIFGNAFDLGAEVAINSAVAVVIAPENVDFMSAQRIDVNNFFISDMSNPVGSHDVTVTNPNGEEFSFIDAFFWDGSQFTVPVRSTTTQRTGPKKGARSKRTRAVQVSVLGRPVGSGGTRPAPPPTPPSGTSGGSTAPVPASGAATATPTTTGATLSSTPSSGTLTGAAAGSNAPAAATTSGPPSAPSGTTAPVAAATPAPSTPAASSSTPAAVPSMTHIAELHQKIDKFKEEIMNAIQALHDAGKKTP